LLIEVDQSGQKSDQTLRVDLSKNELPVIVASSDELQKHEEVMLQIDKSSQGKSVWRQLQAG